MINKWFLTILGAPLVLCADLNDELNKFFNKAGSLVNTTSAEIYQGQKAGYMTGGGLTVRNRIMNTKPVTVNLPRFDAGCGGIDIYSGGFSFINDQQLVDTLKSVGSSAIGYAFMLGLETVSPQVSSVMKSMQTWSNNINAFNINSCEMAHQLVGSAWPRRTRANQEICRTLAGEKGYFSDYVSSRHACSDREKYEKNQKEQAKKSSLGFFSDEINVTWEALRRQPIISSDKQLMELFMTLMGTVIYSKGDHTQITRIPPKINDDTFLDILLNGGEAQMYTCRREDNTQCLNLEEKTVVLSSSNTWLSRVRNVLLQIQDKALRDQELDISEKELLSKTRLPLYKIINVLTAYKRGSCPIDLYQVAEVVAMDLLTQFLKEVVELVRDGAYQLKNEKMYSEDIEEYLADLRRVEETVRYHESRSMQQMEREFLMIQKIQLIEEKIRSEIILN